MTDFEKAVSYVNNGDKKNKMIVSNEVKLNFYKYYKQGTVGKCTESRPGIFKIVERAKWDAWNSVSEMSREAAQNEYVKILTNIKPGWRESKSE